MNADDVAPSVASAPVDVPPDGPEVVEVAPVDVVDTTIPDDELPRSSAGPEVGPPDAEPSPQPSGSSTTIHQPRIYSTIIHPSRSGQPTLRVIIRAWLGARR